MEARTATRIPVAAVAILTLLCFIWGANVVAIKVSIQGVPPLLTAGLRSAVAACLLAAYCLVRGYKVLVPRAKLHHAAVIGTLFALDFLLLYWGNLFTHASRAVIFLYTQPFWTAIGAHFLLRDDRLSLAKVSGLGIAFIGLVPVYLSQSPSLGELHWVGDLMIVGAAFFWAATTLYVKKMGGVMDINHYQCLFAQLFFSVPILLIASFFLEAGRPLHLTTSVALSLVFQCVIVAFFSYLLWFWLIQTYQVSKLAAYTFLAPIFGVLLSGLLLSEGTPALLWAGLALVAAGIYLVNRPENSAVRADPATGPGSEGLL